MFSLIYKQYIVAFADFQDPWANHHSQQKIPNKLNIGGMVSKVQLELV
jgi:hypothetical protein